MAKVDVNTNRLALSSDEIIELTKWRDAMVEDYLTIKDALLLVAEAIDTFGIQTDTPSTATSAGEAGQIAFDATHFYVCISTDVWRRVAIAVW